MPPSIYITLNIHTKHTTSSSALIVSFARSKIKGLVSLNIIQSCRSHLRLFVHVIKYDQLIMQSWQATKIHEYMSGSHLRCPMTSILTSKVILLLNFFKCFIIQSLYIGTHIKITLNWNDVIS